MAKTAKTEVNFEYPEEAHAGGKHPDDIMMKLALGVAGLAAGWVAQKVVSIVWARVLGEPAPKDPHADDLKLSQAATFAAVSAVAAVFTRRLAQRGALRALSAAGV